jgi:hypothetical protein
MRIQRGPKKKKTVKAEVVRVNFSCHAELLRRVDAKLDTLQTKCGTEFPRSMIIQIGFELFLEHFNDLKLTQIFNNVSLKKELIDAIAAEK